MVNKRNNIVYKGEVESQQPQNQELLDLMAKVKENKERLIKQRSKFLECLNQFQALKYLLNRNSKRFKNIKPLGCLKIPLILISFKKGANFLVNEDHNKNSIVLKSDSKPVLYNENHVLKGMNLINKLSIK